MRRLIYIGLFVLSGIYPLFGEPVTRQEVRAVVQSFVSSVFPGEITFVIAEVRPMYHEADTPVYYVNLKPGGWVLVSGDDKATPVLGYSVTGAFDDRFYEQGSVEYWMSVYAKSLAEVRTDRSLRRNSLWNGEPDAYRLKSTAITAVQPLIEVEWDQGKAWNIFCPEDENGPDGRVYVGCVGVCMAQAMSYYQYPARGTGSKTYYQDPYGTIVVHYDRESPYEWDSMTLDAADSYNTKLLYHCAVSVQMDFGADGSSAQTRNIPSALSKYFKYYSGAKYLTRYADDNTWTALLTSELVAGRPLIYSGFPPDDNVGHAFNIDGVDSRGYFHLNWGWNGRYNGYFLINNLRPGSENFTRDQGAVINIRPPVYSPTNLDLTKRTVKEGLPAGTNVALLKITDEAKDNEYYVNIETDSVRGDTNPSPDFYFANDSLKTSRVFLYSEKNEYTIYIEVKDKFENYYQEKFTISVLQNSSVTPVSDFTERGIEIYPNPSSGLVSIRNPFPGRFTVDVSDQWGRVIKHVESDGSQSDLFVNPGAPGLYFLKITPENGQPVTRKIIIR